MSSHYLQFLLLSVVASALIYSDVFTRQNLVLFIHENPGVLMKTDSSKHTLIQITYEASGKM